MAKKEEFEQEKGVSTEELVKQNRLLEIQLNSTKLVKQRLENKLGEAIGNFTALQLSFEQMQEYAQSLEQKNDAE